MWRPICILCSVLGGCVSSTSVNCGSLLCQSGTVCSPDGLACIAPVQLEACGNASDGTGCSYPGTPDGVCRGAVCIPAGCGNGIPEPGEVCDDGNRVSLDGCRSDCASLERCGDGVIEPALGEQCDCGIAGSVSAICTGPNADDEASHASCRTDCQPARCGDGARDEGELCDDGNTVWGDGCRGDCRGRFEKMQSPIGGTYNVVWTSGRTDAYAGNDQFGLVHFDGTVWSTVALGVGRVYAIWGTGPSDVYVGAKADTTPFAPGLFHYNGSTWSRVTSVTAGAERIWGSGTSDVYVADKSGVVRHFDGSQWSPVGWCYAGFPTSVSAIWGTGPSNVLIGLEAGICHFDGSTWSVVYNQDHGITASITGTVPTSMYAFVPPSKLLSWDGSGAPWTPTEIPANPLYAIGATGPDEVLAVGEAGQILQLRQNTWTTLVTPSEQALLAVAATDPTNVFVVGAYGTILH